MPFELGIQVWKIMSFRWRPSSWMRFSIFRLKSSIARANSCWSIVSTSCRMASFNSFKLRGLWVYTRPLGTPRGRNHMMTSQETLGPMAHRRLWVYTRLFRYPPETCSLGASFRISAMCHGPQGLLTCHHVISSSGGTWRAVCTLTNHVIWAVEGCHPARSAHDRSTAVGLSDGRFQAEDWKLHSRGWSSPKWHYFSHLNT